MFWAIGIIVMAIDTVGFAPDRKADAATGDAALTDASGTPITSSDISNFANIANAL